jgi:hypothetical protein
MTTLALQLKTAIELWVNDLRQCSALRLATQGRLPPRAVALYLESLRHLLCNSQSSLVLACRRAEELGDVALAEYFANKAREETGHDLWAVNDLSRLPDDVTAGLRPSPAIVRLVEHQRSLIERHPACFVAYALWAEYFTVLVGDECLAALTTCGFARQQVSSIAGHVDADREHAAQGFAEIDRLWQGQPEAEVMLEAVAEACRIFDQFCAEIAGEALRAA